ncbi:enoyl-CoA hydratase/isomerase family protein [Algisphaera agarilytica]|uniref:Enoyl-CoA hydratase/carnithine racemase n=1 Tax=Algisphaera agarilytica TaxID=1385975 RepID=A0A7X0H8I8_9BACT|nr:enoyl-CoA hydratase-related protein [Algisphaera agarilytica]MBB6431216.1 enoyl-CoA hydratase/carnithine racemase [Algisphaera agarilytica]
MDQMIDVQEASGVCRITLNRPKANAYNQDFLDLFVEVLEQVDASGNARVAVIQSASERFFCAGADIEAFAKSDADGQKKIAATARRVTAMIESSDKVFVASINGHALGGGLELAMACDIRLACDRDYLLGLPEVKLGQMPGNGGSQRLPRLVGFAKGLELTITGDNISPQEAYRIGLVNHLYPADGFTERVEAYVQALAGGPPLAIAAIKRAVRQGWQKSLEDGLAVEASCGESIYDTQDAKEGFQAFLDKRPPIFTGQ